MARLPSAGEVVLNSQNQRALRLRSAAEFSRAIGTEYMGLQVRAEIRFEERGPDRDETARLRAAMDRLGVKLDFEP